MDVCENEISCLKPVKVVLKSYVGKELDGPGALVGRGENVRDWGSDGMEEESEQAIEASSRFSPAINIPLLAL